jgi:hypothetical protein
MTGKIHTVGTRAQVWHGTSKKTSGGLTKSDLMMNKAGRIVSRSKHNSAKKEMRLLKHGYGTQKGKFGFVKVGSRKHRKGSKKMKGGMYSLSPMELGDGIAGAGVTDYSLQGSIGPQERAGQAGGSGMAPLASPGAASWSGDGIDGQGITDYGADGSIGVQEAAGASGGGRRSRGQRRTRGKGRGQRGGTAAVPYIAGGKGRTRGRTRGQGRGKGKGKGMMGGTTSRIPYLSSENPLNRILS